MGCRHAGCRCPGHLPGLVHSQSPALTHSHRPNDSMGFSSSAEQAGRCWPRDGQSRSPAHTHAHTGSVLPLGTAVLQNMQGSEIGLGTLKKPLHTHTLSNSIGWSSSAGP